MLVLCACVLLFLSSETARGVRGNYCNKSVNSAFPFRSYPAPAYTTLTIETAVAVMAYWEACLFLVVHALKRLQAALDLLLDLTLGYRTRDGWRADREEAERSYEKSAQIVSARLGQLSIAVSSNFTSPTRHALCLISTYSTFFLQAYSNVNTL